MSSGGWSAMSLVGRWCKCGVTGVGNVGGRCDGLSGARLCRRGGRKRGVGSVGSVRVRLCMIGGGKGKFGGPSVNGRGRLRFPCRDCRLSHWGEVSSGGWFGVSTLSRLVGGEVDTLGDVMAGRWVWERRGRRRDRPYCGRGWRWGRDCGGSECCRLRVVMGERVRCWGRGECVEGRGRYGCSGWTSGVSVRRVSNVPVWRGGRVVVMPGCSGNSEVELVCWSLCCRRRLLEGGGVMEREVEEVKQCGWGG